MTTEAEAPKNRIALVTGASRGIGRAAALRLAQDGANVAVNYVSNEGAATETAAAIRALGREAIVIRGDVGVAADAEAMVDAVIARWGRIDILVNNAGINRDGLVVRMSEADWDAVLRTNLTGTFLCTKRALRGMLRQRWGRIINLSSVVGVMGNAGQANYAASKAGIIGFTKAIAREAASRNVTANAIAPGYILTDMVDHVPANLREEILNRIPLARFGTAEEVAEVVAFLASDAAAYITGQVIGIDGGLGM